MNEEQNIKKNKEDINLRAEVIKYTRNWYWFVIGVIICLVIAFIYLKYSTPVYKTTAELLVKDDKKGGTPDATAFTELDIFKGGKNIDNEIRVLKSKSLLQKAFRKLPHLQHTQYINKGIRTYEAYGKDAPLQIMLDADFKDSLITPDNGTLEISVNNNNTFSIEGDAKNAFYKFGQKINRVFGSFIINKNPTYKSKEKEYKILFNNLSSYANFYNERMQIATSDKQASTILITLNDPVPQKAKDIINTLISVYNEYAIEDKNVISQNTIKFIDDRLRTLVVELSGVERQVEQFKQRNEVTDISSDVEQYFTQSQDVYRKLEDARLQENILNSIQLYVNNPKNNDRLVPSSLGINDITLNSLVQTFNDLQLKKQEALSTIEPSNIIIQNMDKSIDRVRKSIGENLKNIRRGLSATTGQLSKNLGNFQTKIRTVPAVERGLLEIKRQQGIKEAIYEYLLKKKEESLITLAATVSNSRIIDDTASSAKPVSPKKLIVFIVALLSGLSIPFLILYLKELLNDKVKVQKDITSKINVPVLAEVMHVKTDEELVVKPNTRTPISEVFKLIRSNLRFATAGKEDKVIILTSSMSGEGKTFISTNLGAALALSDKKVVLLEFDLRKPKLLKGLNMKVKNGISNYVINKNLVLDDLINPVAGINNLFVIGAGPIPPNPSELILSERISDLVENLKHRFDYIIIDSPPVGQVSDSFILGQKANISIYVVRYNYTFKEQVNIIEDVDNNKKLNNLMLVFNDAKPENSHGYGYGYGYGYGS